MWQLLSPLRSILLSKLGSSLIGIIAICFLIWFAGPRVGITSAKTRMIIISVIIILYLLILLVKWLWIRARGAKLQQQLQAQEESLAGRQLETELLKEKMLDAVASLKSSELGVKYRGKAALYALPWYMIIGPSASGKSTLLRNSGLHFPFSSQEDLRVKGFGGTRNCDWWFSDQAIILDTAGRYTTEDNDREEWQAFLQLMKKYRPRLPINGIMVAVSLAELLTCDEAGISWHVKVIRERIKELYSQLGFIFPVYLIFTKCDLLKGFDAFFGDLSDADRRQVWGIQLLDNVSDPVTSFKERFQALYAKLTQMRIRKLSIERNSERKANIYDFPEQLRAARDTIESFVDALFKENPYQETPNFCGVYFTSGTQEGAPIQRFVGELKKAFGYVESKSSEVTEALISKSYFIKDLFSEIIFKQYSLAAKTRDRVRVQLWLKSGMVVASMIAIIGAFILYSTSFTSNVILVHRGKNVTKQLVAEIGKAPDIDSQTDQLLDAFNYYQSIVEYRQHIPLHLRLGLYRGNTQIEPLKEMLMVAMNKIFRRPIKQYLQKRLTYYQRTWDRSSHQARNQLRGPYYTTLKAYLMLEFPNRIDVDQASTLLSVNWNDLLTGQTDHSRDLYEQMTDAKQYRDLIVFYLQSLKQSASHSKITEPLHIDYSLVKKARQQLYSPTNASNLYAQISSTGEAKLQPLLLHDFVQGYGANLLLSKSAIPGIFTAKGWKDYMAPAINRTIKTASHGDWVIDASFSDLQKPALPKEHQNSNVKRSEAKLKQQILNLYFSDYVETWFKFMKSIHVEEFQSLNDATKQLTVLANPNGPIAQLMVGISENIDIKTENNKDYVPEIKEGFQGLRKIINPSTEGSVNDVIKSYLHQLLSLQNDLQRLTASSDIERDAEHYASRLLNGSGGDLQLYQAMISVNMITNRLDDVQAHEALKSVLLQPIRESWRSVIFSATQGIQQRWRTQVLNSYRENLAGRFPFDRVSEDNAAVSDVSDFFRPSDGVLWSFVNTYLSPYVYVDEEGWHEQKWLGIGAGFSPVFLNTLTEAKKITGGFFSNNNQVGFNFQIYPQPTPGLSQIILSTNNSGYDYRNGPQQWHTFSWSENATNKESYLTAIAAWGLSPATIHAQGAWSFFRLLKGAKISSIGDGKYRIVWRLHSGRRTYKVSLLLRADHRNNMFQALFFNRFELPVQIFTRNRMT